MANSAWIEFCGVTLSGSHVPDGGVLFTKIDGWGGVTAARGGGDPIPGGHGSFRRVKPALRSERPISITGWILADSRAALLSKIAQMEAAFSGAGEMTVYDDGGVWARWVEVDDFRVDDSHGRSAAAFTLDGVAPDPHRYGPLQRVGPVSLPEAQGGVRLPQRMPWNFGTVADGGRLIVPNSGTIPLSPVLCVSGGFDAVTILDVTAGRRIRLDWPVALSDSVVIDSRSRRVTMGSAEVTRWLTRRQWFEIQPGAVHEFRFDVVGRAGDPSMFAEFREGGW